MLSVIFLSLCLQGPEPAAVAASITSQTRGVRWECALTRETLARSPVWPETDPFPPLSPRRAIELAWHQLGALVTDRDQWRLQSVSLKQVGPSGTWIYVVEIAEPPPHGAGGIHSSIRLVVLLDGTTIAPVRTTVAPALRQVWPPR